MKHSFADDILRDKNDNALIEGSLKFDPHELSLRPRGLAFGQRASNEKPKVLSIDQETVGDLIAEYLHLTKEVLPALARTERKDWPVREDHCFQRIVLDAVCGGVWYEHLDRPAYKNLSPQQAEQTVALCQDIAAGKADLAQLNRQSLMWRGKLRASSNNCLGQ